MLTVLALYFAPYFALYIAPSLIRAAIVLACIVIGLTVRIALMAQPGTRFHSYWRLFFKKPSAKS